ncbi:MAG: hypothetical protein WCE64_09420, partial [Bacteroidales bacterium]
TNTTEALNLIIGPFLYLFIKRSIDRAGSKKEWFHFLPAIVYLGYIFPDFLQPNEFQYNSYVNSMHPEWPLLDTNANYASDPLGIKKYLNLATAAQILIYISLSIRLLAKKSRQSGLSISRTNDDQLRSLRNMVHLPVARTTFRRKTRHSHICLYFIGLTPA